MRNKTKRRKSRTIKSRGQHSLRSPGSAWLGSLSRSGRLLWKVVAAFGLLLLLVGTVYKLKIEPWVNDRLAGKSRLDVQVVSQPQFIPEGLVHSGIYLFPHGRIEPANVPPDLRSLADMPEYEKWAQKSGGVPAQTLALKMTVRAATDAPVVLNGLRVDVIRRSASLVGWFRVPDMGCGVQAVRSIEVDLDRDPVRPMLTEVDGATGEETTRPFDLTLRVTPSDPEVFEIHASTFKSDVEFRMTLLYQSERASGEFPVEGGRTYHVTALQAGRAEAYNAPYDFPTGSASAHALVRARYSDPGPRGLTFC